MTLSGVATKLAPGNKPFDGTLPFIDLKAQYALIEKNVQKRMAQVLEHGNYIMGPEVADLEKKLCAYTGAKHTVSCSSGTDAVWLPLLALGVRPGDAVFVPSFTFTATAEAVALCGASPVFVDVHQDTFNMCPESLERAITQVKKHSTLTPRAIITVDLFGLPADYASIASIAAAHELKLIADAAQSFGGSIQGRKVGSLAPVTATSFFPAKPLGCYGDGGAIFLDDDEMNETLCSIRIHGRGLGGKYDNVRIGTNARLDTLQAAILLEKLVLFPKELEDRQKVAALYSKELACVADVPEVPETYQSAWAQYTLKNPKREHVIAVLKDCGIPLQVYYPKPLHLQTPYKDFPLDPKGLKNTEALSRAVFSLPMHPYLQPVVQHYIITRIKEALS